MKIRSGKIQNYMVKTDKNFWSTSLFDKFFLLGEKEKIQLNMERNEETWQ